MQKLYHYCSPIYTNSRLSKFNFCYKTLGNEPCSRLEVIYSFAVLRNWTLNLVQTELFLYPISLRLNCLKTTPLTSTHTHIWSRSKGFKGSVKSVKLKRGYTYYKPIGFQAFLTHREGGESTQQRKAWQNDLYCSFSPPHSVKSINALIKQSISFLAVMCTKFIL